MSLERCLNCGHKAMGEQVLPFQVEHGGKTVSIQDRVTVCTSCGQRSYSGSQVSAHEHAVAAAIREIDGLLSAEDLRRIRAKYGFRQTDMEQMLSTGPKTWTRWERGKVPQSRATDVLIRLIADDPYVARKLMQQAGIINADAEAIFEQIDQDRKVTLRSRLRHELLEQSSYRVEEVVDQVADRTVETVYEIRHDEARAA